MSILQKTQYLILDIDHTLIHCMLQNDVPSNANITNSAMVVCKYEVEYSELKQSTEEICAVNIFIRPGLFEFLDWCNQNFIIIIYSAGLPVYIDMILKYFISILPNLEIHDIYSRNDLVPYQLNNQMIFVKSIMAIPYLSGLGDNYVIIDDIVYHYPYSQEKRILISEWQYDMEDDCQLELVTKVLATLLHLE